MAADSERNVLFVAYYFPPRGGSGVQRSQKFAKYLSEFGYRPLVLTVDERDITATYDPTLLNEVSDAQVFRSRSYETTIKRLARFKLGPLVQLLLRPDAHVLWSRGATRIARQIAREHSIDTVYTSIQPWSSALVGAKLKRLLGVPWVLDYRDLWTDSTHLTWPTKLHYRLDARMERRVLSEADAVVVVTPTMKDVLANKYPHWADKIHVIHNGFDEEDVLPQSGHSDLGKLTIGFAGRLYAPNRLRAENGRGLAGRLREMLSFRHVATDFSTHSPLYLFRALRKLLDERPELSDKLTLSFAGTFPDENRRLVRDLKLEKVVSIKGYMSHTEAVQLLIDSDVLFLPMMSEADGRRSYNLSGKVFEYLATRKPILAAVPPGDLGDLITRSAAGWHVNPHDVNAIKTLLAELIEQKASGNLKVTRDGQYIAQFSRRNQTARLASLFDSLRGQESTSSSSPNSTDAADAEMHV